MSSESTEPSLPWPRDPAISYHNHRDYIVGNGGLHGKMLVHEQHGRRADTSGEPDRGMRARTQRVGSAWAFRSVGAGGESTVMMGMVAEYEDNGVLGNNDGFVELSVDSGASEHYPNDRPGMRERLSDYVRFKEPHEVTTAGCHRDHQRLHHRPDRG